MSFLAPSYMFWPIWKDAYRWSPWIYMCTQGWDQIMATILAAQLRFHHQSDCGSKWDINKFTILVWQVEAQVPMVMKPPKVVEPLRIVIPSKPSTNTSSSLPMFNPSVKLFQKLHKNHYEVWMEKLWSL
jgi:hypothetical protein